MVDDDLFAAFSDSESDGEADDDPFAALDGGDEDDPFAALGGGDDEDDPFAEFQTDDADDPFASLDDSAEAEAPAAADAPPAEQPPVEEEGDTPAWLSELRGDYEGEQAAARPAEAEKNAEPGLLSTLVGTGPEGMAFGMTAQQRMILSIFLFLDVAVLGCMILLAIGAISVG